MGKYISIVLCILARTRNPNKIHAGTHRRDYALTSKDERALLALLARLGGMGISIVSEIAEAECNNSHLVTELHRKLIIACED